MENIILFKPFSILFIASPGPAVFYFATSSSIFSRSQTWYALVGNTLGLAVHATLAAFGIGLLLSESVYARSIVSIVGASYLIYIGYQRFSNARTKTSASKTIKEEGGLVSGFLLAITNPKPLLFFTLILPSFFSSGEILSQSIVYSCIFLLLSFIILLLYAHFGRKVLGTMHNVGFRRHFDQMAGLVFIVLALWIMVSTIFMNSRCFSCSFVKWPWFSGQVCGLAKMHLVSVYNNVGPQPCDHVFQPRD